MLTKIPCRQRMKLCARARKWFYSVVIILWDLILKKCWLYLNCLPVIHLQCCFCWQPHFSVLSTTYSHPADLNCRCSSYILNLTGYPSRNYLASLSAAGAAIRKGGFWKTVQDGFDKSKIWEFSFAFHRKTKTEGHSCVVGRSSLPCWEMADRKTRIVHFTDTQHAVHVNVLLPIFNKSLNLEIRQL